MSNLAALRGLAMACHPLPTVAVTVLALLLAVRSGGPGEVVIIVITVLFGQLVIGWHNDLLDVRRDEAAGRNDKPIARGEVSPRTVRLALGGALVVTVLMSWVSSGWLGVVLHVGLVVGSGLAYNAGLKATAWSWLPYAVAFGALPEFVWLSAGRGAATWWVVTVGALLGVGAHLLNVLPDLDEDLRAGIRGFPHRIGWTRSKVLAPVLLLTGTILLTVAASWPSPAWAWSAVGAAAILAFFALVGRGRAPFLAAVGIALVNVTALALAG